MARGLVKDERGAVVLSNSNRDAAGSSPPPPAAFTTTPAKWPTSPPWSTRPSRAAQGDFVEKTPSAWRTLPVAARARLWCLFVTSTTSFRCAQSARNHRPPRQNQDLLPGRGCWPLFPISTLLCAAAPIPSRVATTSRPTTAGLGQSNRSPRPSLYRIARQAAGIGYAPTPTICRLMPLPGKSTRTGPEEGRSNKDDQQQDKSENPRTKSQKSKRGPRKTGERTVVEAPKGLLEKPSSDGSPKTGRKKEPGESRLAT